MIKLKVVEPELVKVSVNLDLETFDQLRELEELAGANVRGRRSAVLRAAIRAYRATFPKEK